MSYRIHVYPSSFYAVYLGAWRAIVVCAALLVIAPVYAQTSPLPHPMLPPQPRPAGSMPSSGSGPQSGDRTTAPESAHSGMAMPAGEHASGMPMDHEMKMSTSFGPVADSQEASGTAWQPEATPMHAMHSMIGDWQLMTHYNAFVAYDHQSGSRDDDQINSINWLMLMATKRSGENELTLRGMFSLEPATTTSKGYPLLFQSGESYHGQPLVDRQHPHDCFMELAARYRRLVNPETALSLYVAPSGEPALGPPAFMHRASAMDNPAAPISHHWLDSTHIAYGVLTAGVARKAWQLEGSWFNGREPDEDRWDIEHPKLDSYAGRFTWNPSPDWSAQISHGYLKSPEELHPREHVWRTTASLMHIERMHEMTMATTLAWGRNDSDSDATDALLLETNCSHGAWNVFGRAEYVEKTGEELDLRRGGWVSGAGVSREKFPIKQITAGVSRELVKDRPYQLALGGSVSYSFQPDTLDPLYGRHPIGVWVFLRLRPAAMAHSKR